MPVCGSAPVFGSSCFAGYSQVQEARPGDPRGVAWIGLTVKGKHEPSLRLFFHGIFSEFISMRPRRSGPTRLASLNAAFFIQALHPQWGLPTNATRHHFLERPVDMLRKGHITL